MIILILKYYSICKYKLNNIYFIALHCITFYLKLLNNIYYNNLTILPISILSNLTQKKAKIFDNYCLYG